MKVKCSQCKGALTSDSASHSVATTGRGRCRSCENAHAKVRSRTLGGRYTAGRGQAKFNKHKWELSFQQYAAIVSSRQCFYCGKPSSDGGSWIRSEGQWRLRLGFGISMLRKAAAFRWPTGLHETKSGEIAPILLFVRRRYEMHRSLPTERDFINKVCEFEAGRNAAFKVISSLNLQDLRNLRRAKSVREYLERVS